MKLIIGLGNPGKEYENTRHNAGFLALDAFLKDKDVKWSTDTKFESEIFETIVAGTKMLFVKPQGFMNNSGETASKLCNFHKIDAKQDLLVVHDDVDLPLGTARAADNSSSAGHKGVQNIIDRLGSQEFHRIRIGVDQRAAGDPVPTEAYVLQKFTADEIDRLQDIMRNQVNPMITGFLNDK